MSFAERLARILETREDLPALPASVMQVRALLAREEVNSQEISAHISRDPALAPRLLRAANAAAIARAGITVTSIDGAVGRLGFRRIASLCMAVETVRMFGEGRNLDYQAFWTHSFAVGQVASAIAAKRGIGDPSDHYIAGLLHDVGIFFLDQYMPDVYAQLRETAEPGSPRWRHELQLLGMDHGQMGAKLLERWCLPAHVGEAVAHHHQVPWEPGPLRQAALLLAAAEGLVAEYGEGLEEEGPCDPDVDQALAGLGINEVDATNLRIDLAGVAMEAAGLLTAAA